MAGLKFFVSSTCYDLTEERNQIRNFIKGLGHEPVLSDHNEILYDYDEHTHLSCVREVSNVDVVVLIIGARFGGVAIGDTRKLIDLNQIQNKLHNKSMKDIFEMIEAEKKSEKDKAEASKSQSEPYSAKSIGFSITHFEILKAIEQNIPIYVFIKDKIANFYDFYIQNNQTNPLLTFPDFSLAETKYLAEFITILKRRKTNNSIFEYSNYIDIESQLKQQLAMKFRNLLLKEKSELKAINEQRTQMDGLSRQFEDLRVAILESIENDDRRTIAKGVIKYKILYNCVNALIENTHNVDKNFLKTDSLPSWNSFIFEKIKIKEILDPSINEVMYQDLRKARLVRDSRFESISLFLIRPNDFFEVRYGIDYFQELENSWGEFITLSTLQRTIILETLTDMTSPRTFRGIQYKHENFYEYVEVNKIKHADSPRVKLLSAEDMLSEGMHVALE